MKYAFYRDIYNAQAKFYKKHAWARKTLAVLNKLLVWLIVLCYVFMVILAIGQRLILDSILGSGWLDVVFVQKLHGLLIDRADNFLLAILTLPAICLVTTSVFRVLVNRPRPYAPLDKNGTWSTSGAGIVPLIPRYTADRSFPSRHLASAVVIGIVGCIFCPMIGIPVLVLGALLGYVRFAGGLHYPSDLLAGILFGLVFGLPALILV